MKTTKTYSIEESVYKFFDQTCKKNNINKSSFIVNCIKDYLKENLGFDNEKLYYLRENNNYMVSIISSDDTYFNLSDGSVIPQILFYQTFVQVETVNPDEFFNKTLSPTEKMNNLIVKEEKEIDPKTFLSEESPLKDLVDKVKKTF